MFVAMLRVDIVVDLDVALAGQLGVPVALGVVALTSLVLSVLERMSLVTVLAIVTTISSHIPVELVVRNVLKKGISNR